MNRNATLGAAAWIFALQFFVVQGIVQSAWTTPFSLAHNMISDLGRETCGPLHRAPGIEVACSPWHALMNASIILNGVLIPLGAFLTRRLWPACRPMTIALAMIVLTAGDATTVEGRGQAKGKGQRATTRGQVGYGLFPSRPRVFAL